MSRERNNLPQEAKNLTQSEFKSYLNKNQSKTPPNYNCGKLLGQTFYSRIRLGCSTLARHLFLKNIIDNPLCQCGEVESVEHLFYCPIFDTVRRDTIGSLTFQLNSNYYTNKY